MAKGERVQFKRGPSSSLPSLIEPGSYLVETDTGNMYVDNSTNDRIQITDTRKQDDLELSKTLSGTTLRISPSNSTHVLELYSNNNKIVYNSSIHDFNNGTLKNVATPQAGTDGVNKSYVDTAFVELETEIVNTAAASLPLKGGTMTGDIDLDGHKLLNIGSPEANGDAATKEYVDNKTAGLLSLSGGTLTGNINANNNTITNVKMPTNANDVASKAYVDGKSAEYLQLNGSALQTVANNVRFNGTLYFKDGVVENTLSYDDSIAASQQFDTLQNDQVPCKKAIADKLTASLATKLSLTGGTLTGALTVPSVVLTSGTITAEPAQDNDIANKAYVDDAVGNANYDTRYLRLTGGTLTGQLSLATGVGLIAPAGSKIQVTDAPQSNTDVVNKQYLDDAIADISSGTAYLPLTGGTLTGPLTASAEGITIPTTPSDSETTKAANVAYVNTQIDNLQSMIEGDIADAYLPLTGGTLTGGLTATGVTVGTIQITDAGISGLSSDPETYPATSDQVATKAYVDYKISNPSNEFDEIIIGKVRLRWDEASQDLVVESYTA